MPDNPHDPKNISEVVSDNSRIEILEDALRESKEQASQQKRFYETITAGTPDLIYVFDLNYQFTYVNQSLLSMWGKSWEDSVGKGLRENGYEEWHAQMHEREIDQVRETKQPIRGEVTFPHATLGTRYYDYIFTPVLNQMGEVESIVGSTRDVTERKQFEQLLAKGSKDLQAVNEEQTAYNEELTASNEELAEVNQQLIEAQQKIEEARNSLQLAIDAANFGTWHIHSETREFVTDARLKELFGYYPDEALSIEQAIAQITEEYRGYVATKLENAIYHNGDYDVTYPVVGLHDNQLRWLRAVGNLKADPSGAFSAFTGVVMDVTEQKLDDLRKNDFIGMVSHELKTPLTSLTAIVQLVKSKLRDSDDAFLSGSMERANIQAKRMATMINGFLNVSRLESGKISIERRRFNMADLIKESEEETISMYTSHQIVFEPVAETYVNADRDKIGQVVSNLISNAVKYSKTGSSINVDCVIKDKFAVVSVRDRGIGIKTEEINRLFERYYRVESNNHISGFGIGLYLCSEIIERHQGEIWAESEPGKGSTFYFSLPII